MKLIIHAISSAYYYILGNVFAIFLYDRKYITGRYFEGVGIHKYTAPGWKWVVQDGFARILLRSNSLVPWPVGYKNTVTHPENIIFSTDDLNIFHTYGVYFQAIDAKIYIGKGTWIAPNVGLITANHNIYDLEKHTPGKDIVLGEACWIGMNSVILPGVHLGNNTIVGAGSVVTKSFIEGNCVIAGNPARIIKKINIEEK